MIGLPEHVVLVDGSGIGTAAQHRLEHEHVADDVLVEDVEREQGMTEVVEHTHEEHQVESLAKLREFVYGHPPELDVGGLDLRREPRLRQVALVRVEAKNARGAAPLHFDGIEAGVTADVEHRPSGQVRRNRIPRSAATSPRG